MRDPFNTALYAGMLTYLLSVEGSVGAYVGTLVKIIVILACVQWILRANGVLSVQAEVPKSAG